MKIQVKLLKTKSWGRFRYYPQCPVTKAICRILKHKSLTQDQITDLNEEGIEVIFIGEKPV